MLWASLVGSAVKEFTCNTGAAGDWVQSLGQEDSLEEGMATHSSILGWRIPWTEEPGGLWSIGLQRVRRDSSNLALTHTCCVIKGNPKGYVLYDSIYLIFLK